jgi:hypothetical protein
MVSFRSGIGDDLGGKRIGQGKMVSSNKRGEDVFEFMEKPEVVGWRFFLWCRERIERNFELAGAIKIYSLSGEFREFKSTKLRAHRCKIWLW